jgi:hypothetical protein
MTGVSYVSYPYYFYLNMAFSSSSKKKVTDAVVLVVAFVRAEKDEEVEKELIA